MALAALSRRLSISPTISWTALAGRKLSTAQSSMRSASGNPAMAHYLRQGRQPAAPKPTATTASAVTPAKGQSGKPFQEQACLKEALVQLLKWKEKLYNDGVLGLQQDDVLGWMGACGIQAEEVAAFQKNWDKLHQDPGTPHRFVDQARCVFTLGPEHSHDVSAEPEFIHQPTIPWQLTTDDMVGNLADLPRDFASLDLAVGNGQTWCQNPVVRALNLLMAKMIDSRPGSGCYSPPDCEESDTFILSNFAVRTFCDADNCGDPSPEGVHTDGNALSAIMFVGSDNVLPGSGTNRVFDSKMNLGEYDETDFQRPGGLRDQHLIKESAFETPFELVILLDRLVKHEGRPMQQVQINRQAHRDAYLLFLRNPKLDGSDRIDLGKLGR